MDEISIHALREEGDAVSRLEAQATGNFYPRPPRGGRPGSAVLLHESPDISIHALREEGDKQAIPTVVGWGIFLSTPSARRATC